MTDTGEGFEGSVMSIIWTPSPLKAVTRAYVDELIVTVVMPNGLSSPV